LHRDAGKGCPGTDKGAGVEMTDEEYLLIKEQA